MRCKYCGTKIRERDDVCKGCSAPVPVVNHAAGWALCLSILGLVFSVFPVFNLPFLILAIVFMIAGFVLSGAREGKGRTPSIAALILIVLSIGLTIFLVVVYRDQYDTILENAQSMVDSQSQKDMVKQIIDIMTFNLFKAL